MSLRFRATVGAAASLALLTGLAAARPASADTLVTAGADKKVKLWNASDGKLIKSIDAHDGAINVIALSWDGKLLATGGADKKVKLWNASDGKLIKSVDAHDGAVTALWFGMDNTKLFTGGADKKVKVWALPEGKSEASVDASDGAVNGVIAVQMMIITGGGEGAKIWDETGNLIVPLEHPGMKCMAVNMTEAALYTADKDGTIKWWTQASGNGDFEGTQGSAINVMVSTPDGKRLIAGGANGTIKVWNTDSKKIEKEIADAHKGGVNAIVTSPDGKSVVTAGADKAVKIWGADGKPVKTVENAHEGAVTALIYIPTKEAEKEKSEAK